MAAKCMQGSRPLRFCASGEDFSGRLLIFSRGDHDVPISHVTVFTSLQVDGSGKLFVAVSCAARNARDLLPVNNRLSVLDHGDGATDQRDIKALPFARSPRHFRRGSDKAVHPAGMMTRRLLNRVVFDLNFVTAAQINNTVGICRAVELSMYFEILE